MERKKDFRDRVDGYYIKDMDSFHTYLAHMNGDRTICEVCMLSEFDVTKLMEFLDKLNADREDKVKFFHAFVTASSKVAYNREKFNIFVSNKKYYMRKEIIMSFVAKKYFGDDATEAMMMFRPKEDDTLLTFSDKLNSEVHKAKSDKGESYGADSALDGFAHLPFFLRNLVMKVFYFMDRHGLFPKSFMDVDPNYSTVLFSNLGSIKCHSVYHHLSNFGTNSIVFTIGTMRDEVKVIDGKQQNRKIVDFGITIDERIGDGFYFAKSMKLMQYFFDNPELLLEPMGKKYDVKF